MGEYMGTTVEIGGKIKASDIERLAAELLDGDEDSILDAAKAKETLVTYGETNFGFAEELCATVAELGMSYRRTSEAKYEYGSEGTYHNGETGASIDFTCDQGGDPSVGLGQLRECQRAGQSVADLIAKLEAPTKKLPPIEIIDDTPVGG